MSSSGASRRARSNRARAGARVAVEVGEQLEAEVQRHHGMGDLVRAAPCGQRRAARDGSSAAAANCVQGTSRALTSAPSPGVEVAPAIISTSRAASPLSRSSAKIRAASSTSSPSPPTPASASS